MAQKIVFLEGVGEITLSKRKGTKNIRMSVGPTGKVRVGIPYWLPYSAGLQFADRRRDWITKHQPNFKLSQLANGSKIGKSYRLDYIYEPGRAKTATRIKDNSVRVVSGLNISNVSLQVHAVKAAERALKKEAEALLPDRLIQLANRYGYSFKSVKVKRMTSRWGSCSSDKLITLNYYLMQLPWQLIDYVLVHELIHTKHLNHSQQFWSDFEIIVPNAKLTRKQLKDYRPVFNPTEPGVA